MTTTFNPLADRYFVCPQAGPYAMGYGNFTVPNCYGGDCSTLCGNPKGPFLQCSVRERLRDFYADGVQGGTCQKNCPSSRTDSGLSAPFMTYGVNYWGDNDLYRQRPYGGGVDTSTGSSCTSQSTSNNDAFGHYVNNNFACTNSFDTPLMISPVPGVIEAKMLNSVEWPGSQNTCTSKI